MMGAGNTITIIFFSILLLFQVATVSAVSEATQMSRPECVDNFWHLITYDISNPEKPKKIEDRKTNEKCQGGTTSTNYSVMECRKNFWHIVVYEKNLLNPKKPKELSAVKTQYKCKAVDTSTDVTGVIGQVFLVKQICKNNFWHIVTYDLTNPVQPSKKEINTGFPCDPKADQNDGIITKLECLNGFYILQDYLVWSIPPPGGSKKISGHKDILVPDPTNPNVKKKVPCVDPPLRLSLSSAQSSENASIPGWIKKNADWWARGSISDREFAAGLGFMVKEKIINVQGVQLDPNGNIAIDDNLQLPKWIRNNAEWWVAGAIPDEDFKSGIQFMLTEKIIDFKAKPVIQQAKRVLDPDVTKSIFEIQMWNVVAFTQLNNIKNFEAEILNDVSDDVWKQYADSDSDIDVMNNAVDFGNAANQAKEESLLATKILKAAKGSMEKSKSTAIQAGNHVLDLEDSVIDQLAQIDAKFPKISNYGDLKDEYKKVKKSEKNANDGLKEVLVSRGADESTVLSYSDSAYLKNPIDSELLSNTGTLSSTKGTTIASNDGKFIVKFLPDSAPSTIVSIKEISKDRWNDDIKSLGPIGTVYDLKPDGLQLTKPATIILNLDASELGIDLKDGVPLFSMLSQSSDRTITPLENVKNYADLKTGKITVSGKASHFSISIVTKSGFTASIFPPAVQKNVGETFNTNVFLEGSEADDMNTINGATSLRYWSFPSELDPLVDNTVLVKSHANVWTCLKAGNDFPFTAYIVIPYTWDFKGKPFQSGHYLDIHGFANCLGSTGITITDPPTDPPSTYPPTSTGISLLEYTSDVTFLDDLYPSFSIFDIFLDPSSLGSFDIILYDIPDLLPIPPEFFNENEKIKDSFEFDPDVVIETEVPDSSDNEEEEETLTETAPEDKIVKQISVMVIGGQHYPKSQFNVADPDLCDALHYHAETVYSLEGGSANETQGECGFGKVGTIPIDVADLTQEDIDNFKSLTGIDL